MRRMTMALGRRKEKQVELFVATARLRQGPGHPFYRKLDEVLAGAGFDAFVEGLCASFYREGGRPGIPPGVYFRMLFIGYFEGIDSRRGIAWRCADSLALRSFLGPDPAGPTPVHAPMSVIRQRLPETLFDEVFNWVLGLLGQKGLLKGKTLGIDATTLEADAVMRSIVRKDTGAGWKEYLRTLAKAEGIESPADADLQRLDRARTEKKVSNEHWKSPSGPEARIARMKDGTTHLAYKAGHAVDLETGAMERRERRRWSWRRRTWSSPAVMQRSKSWLPARAAMTTDSWPGAPNGRSGPTSRNGSRRAGAGRTNPASTKPHSGQTDAGSPEPRANGWTVGAASGASGPLPTSARPEGGDEATREGW